MAFRMLFDFRSQNSFQRWSSICSAEENARCLLAALAAFAVFSHLLLHSRLLIGRLLDCYKIVERRVFFSAIRFVTIELLSNGSKCFQMLPNASQCSSNAHRVLQSVSKCLEMPSDASKCLQMPMPMPRSRQIATSSPQVRRCNQIRTHRVPIERLPRAVIEWRF